MEGVGNKLKIARIKKNLTQKEVQELTGITVVTLSNIESGKVAHPQADTIKKLCRAYKIKVESLFE